MHRFARYYVRFTQEGKEPDSNLHAAFRDLRTLEVNVARPFLLRLYEDYDQGTISKVVVLKTLRLIESYVFRRSICGIPTNTLNQTFAGLDREIAKHDYLDSLQAALLLKDSYRRFPNDEEFKREIVVKDVYNFRTRNYLLGKLENFGRKEVVDVEAYTIEHILPQTPNLRLAWQAALGDNWKEIQQRLLHTLGNLTLTGYNSEYGDRSFSEKREMIGGFRESPLRLNQGLGQIETWDATEIAMRAEKLATKAANIWLYPIMTDAELSEFRPADVTTEDDKIYALEDHAHHLNGEMRKLFDELSKRVLNLDSSVRIEPKKLYIAFKSITNFVDIVPQKRQLRLFLNMNFDEIDDPTHLCKDVSGIGRWGNGDVSLCLESANQVDEVLYLVRQALHKQIGGNDQIDDLR